jgi:hypothetical protein
MGYNIKPDWKNFNAQMRKYFDANDPRIYKGMNIVGARRNGGPGGRRPIPKWMADLKLFEAVILRAFPKVDSDPRQHQAASRWARIAYLLAMRIKLRPNYV